MRNIILLISILLMTAMEVKAEDLLFGESCNEPVSFPAISGLRSESRAPSTGLRCEDIKKYEETVEVMKIALMPVTAALANPSVRSEIARQLAILGITTASPAILAVTVVGAAGLATFYVVMRKSIEDCRLIERQQLKRELISELSRKYNAHSGQNVRVQFVN